LYYYYCVTGVVVKEENQNKQYVTRAMSTGTSAGDATVVSLPPL